MHLGEKDNVVQGQVWSCVYTVVLHTVVTLESVVEQMSAEVVFRMTDGKGVVFRQTRKKVLTLHVRTLGKLAGLSEPLAPCL